MKEECQKLSACVEIQRPHVEWDPVAMKNMKRDPETSERSTSVITASVAETSKPSNPVLPLLQPPRTVRPWSLHHSVPPLYHQ